MAKNAPRDENDVPALLATSSVDGTAVVVYADPVTHRLLVDSAAGGTGTVTSVSVVTANGVSGSVATETTTPAITLVLGAITPSSVNGVVVSGTGSLANSGTTSLTGFTGSGTSSGTNTGDQTSVSGNAGTATALQTARTIAGVSFNGTANIAIASTNLSDTASIVLLTTTQTLTNKRITRRVVTTTQSATPTINTDNTDIAAITGLAQAITSFTTNLSGTPVAGDYLMIQITDNGTARAISWGSSFEATTIALPTTTVISTLLRVGFQWNPATSKWSCIAVA